MAATSVNPGDSGDTRRLFVTGINPNISKENLEEYFGSIAAVSDVYMPVDKYTQKPRGLAFITFVDEGGLKAALIKDSHVINGESLICKKAEPRRNSKFAAQQSSSSGNRIFIPDTQPIHSKADLDGHFSKFGEVTDVYFPLDRHTQQRKGICFITFSTSDGVQKALQESSHVVNGETLTVTKAVAKPTFHSSRRPPPRGYSEPYAPRPPRVYEEPSRGRYPPPGDYGSRYAPPPHIPKERIFVGGVPEGLTAGMLSTHFEQYGHVHDCYMPRDRVTQKSRGFAYVDFKDEKIASIAVSRSDRTINGFRVTDIKLAEPKPASHAPKHHPSASRYAPPPASGYYDRAPRQYSPYSSSSHPPPASSSYHGRGARYDYAGYAPAPASSYYRESSHYSPASQPQSRGYRSY